MDSLSNALALLPSDLARVVRSFPPANRGEIEELRLGRGLPVTVRTGTGDQILSPHRLITSADIDHIVLSATGGSYHSAAETIRQGYIPMQGGGRIGLCGEGAMRDGKIESLRNISSLCIRIPKPAHGCADALIPQLCPDRFQNTLIISPPGMGKTTLLRELIRTLSVRGLRVAVADERGEIASMYRGVPQFDLGPNTDVISNVTKCQAGVMLIRSMAPDILAMDEITAAADLPAVLEAAGCGVGLLATVHGADAAGLKQKRLFKELFSYDIFQKAVSIRREHGKRIYTVTEL